ncbi:phosphatase PAP2 family protein [Pedobacter nototheniae]|uniref:phosphatase PAP2 family protein n=1 Tax=Pedobacter nototheniae TaxID=2488994 RepID=UPI00292D4C39|nr:phosphatase PAP2 family protein [Pedobacter nototheniae]
MLRLIKKHHLYFTLTSITLFIFLGISLILNKKESFVLLNGFHCEWLNNFFIFYTHLGDGLVFIAVVIIFIAFKKRKKAATLLLGYLSSGVATLALKRIFLLPRPKLYFENMAFEYGHFIPGVTLHGSNAFPSGHTTSVFCLATILILIFKKQKLCIPCFIVAVTVGYSRIYLAQHFLQDVVFGVFIGTLFGLLSYHCVYKQKILKPIKKFFKIKKQKSLPLADT